MAFVKPLRYDALERVFPDFRSTDAGVECAVDVWGMMGNAEYEAREEEKIESYRSRGVKVIAWDTRAPLGESRPACAVITTELS
jgi:hypothetical protein